MVVAFEKIQQFVFFHNIRHNCGQYIHNTFSQKMQIRVIKMPHNQKHITRFVLIRVIRGLKINDKIKSVINKLVYFSLRDFLSLKATTLFDYFDVKKSVETKKAEHPIGCPAFLYSFVFFVVNTPNS